MFTDEQKTALAAPLDRKHVKTRKQAGRELSYVEGWHVIAEANRIFGFDSWTSETTELRCVAERERKVGQPPRERDGWGVSYIARVSVIVFAGDTLVTREGVGSGHGIDVDLGQAHESAVKEAETDARKRALMTFGNPFGLALYDKEQAQVCDTPKSPLPAGSSEERADYYLTQVRDAFQTEGEAGINRVIAALQKSGEIAALADDDLERVRAAVAALRASARKDAA